MDEVDTTSVAEVKPSHNQDNVPEAKDATPSIVDESTEQVEEVINKMQMLLDQGVVDSTPLAREDAVPSQRVETIDIPNSPSPFGDIEIPKRDLSQVI
nr:hypothetical protein Itr_chr10CG15790 [Ipomoea trifida]